MTAIKYIYTVTGAAIHIVIHIVYMAVCCAGYTKRRLNLIFRLFNLHFIVHGTLSLDSD